MASSTPFDGTNFLTTVPTDGEPHGNDFQEHQATKKSMEFVNNKEHAAIAQNPSAANGGGEHNNGSSVAYFASTAPTNRPDGATALADNDVDKGRVWFDSTFDPPVMMKWDGSAWAQAGNKALHLSFYTGVDQAETGTTDLIKAGRNVADDADVAFLPDKARLATDADPIEDTDIAHKKYVDAGASVYARLYKSSEDQTITSDTSEVLVVLDGESFDSGTIAESNKITPGVAGIYQVNANVAIRSVPAGDNVILRIKKSGTTDIAMSRYTVSTAGANDDYIVPVGGDLVQMNDTDYLELYTQSSTGNYIILNDTDKTFLSLAIQVKL